MAAVRRHFIDVEQFVGDSGLISAKTLANDLTSDLPVVSSRMPGPGDLSSAL